MLGLLGKKLGMTQVFSDNGKVAPVTILQVGPCPILDIKTKEKHGYSALQLGFLSKNKANKATMGNLKKAGLKKPVAQTKEIRLEEDPKQQIGDELTLELFNEIKYVDIISKTKGKGFQGVVKRYNFGGGRASHGGDWTRKPGSIGMCQFPGKVYKGRKMPGQMGNKRKTVQNLEVVRIDLEDNLILVKGAVPGTNGTFVIIRKAIKK